MMAINLHIHLKFLMDGSRALVVQLVTVFLDTAIWYASSFCCTLFSLSLALSHAPNVLCFMVFKMVVATLLWQCDQVYFCFRVWG